MKQLLCIFSLLLSTQLFAQDLSPEAMKIKKAYDELIKDPSFAEAQMQYIIDFPADKETFIRVFNSPHIDQLYPQRFAYLDTFTHLAAKYPEAALLKCISLSKEMLGAGDVLGEIQKLLITLAPRYPETFAAQLRKMFKPDAKLIAYFMGDTNDPQLKACNKQLIKGLRQLDQNRQIDIFIATLKEVKPRVADE